VGLTRILKSQAGTLSHTFLVDETPTDSSVTVTYSVLDANGTSVASGNASSAGVGSGRYTFTLPSQSQLKRGTVAWAGTIGGNATTETDHFEIVSSFFFSLKEGRDSDESLSSSERYTTDDLKTKRTEVEVEVENICDQAFFPRYERVVLDGSGTSHLVLKMSDPIRSIANIRTIRRISVAPDVDETFVDFTAAELAGVAPLSDGTLVRTDGNVFTEGRANVVVEFEYGLDGPPSDLIPACLTRFRSRLNFNKSGIPDRATSYSMGEFGTYRLDMPDSFKTGLPEVDAVYSRYSRRVNGSGANAKRAPASRTLTYHPQRYSLFHQRYLR
jgi:hypothetical protein